MRTLPACRAEHGRNARFFGYNVPTTMPAKTLDEIIAEILDLAAQKFRVPRAELSPDDDFFKKLEIDSLQALDLLTGLERHFSIELPDYEIAGVSDFRTLAERIQARVG
jgi:acyl carrier protein